MTIKRLFQMMAVSAPLALGGAVYAQAAAVAAPRARRCSDGRQAPARDGTAGTTGTPDDGADGHQRRRRRVRPGDASARSGDADHRLARDRARPARSALPSTTNSGVGTTGPASSTPAEQWADRLAEHDPAGGTCRAPTTSGSRSSTSTLPPTRSSTGTTNPSARRTRRTSARRPRTDGAPRPRSYMRSRTSMPRRSSPRLSVCAVSAHSCSREARSAGGSAFSTWCSL